MDLVKGVNPHNRNGTQGRVFVCTIGEYLSRDASFNFKQKNNIFLFRNVIAYTLCPDYTWLKLHHYCINNITFFFVFTSRKLLK